MEEDAREPRRFEAVARVLWLRNVALLSHWLRNPFGGLSGPLPVLALLHCGIGAATRPGA
jgi:hypothetical protein